MILFAFVSVGMALGLVTTKSLAKTPMRVVDGFVRNPIIDKALSGE